MDKETLKKAVENPEAYKDLVVRIGGYSDYFVRLSPEMQQDFSDQPIKSTILETSSNPCGWCPHRLRLITSILPPAF